jgi:amphi-Trp domain-containing protein
MKKQKKNRDLEKRYPKKAFIAKLRRLADALENDGHFSIQIDGERIHVPVSAIISIEHERGIESEEIEFQLKWKYNRKPSKKQ